MRLFILLLLFFIPNGAKSQIFKELRSCTTYKFPEFEYKENHHVEEKINSFLQLKHLKHLPEQFDEHPFERVLEPDYKLEYDSWKHFQLHPNIVYVSIYGRVNDNFFEDIR